MNLMISFASRYAGRRFAGKEVCARNHLQVRVLAQPVVLDDDPQRVQQLSLVFVNPFDLAVENRLRVHNLPRRSFEPVRKPRFGLAFDARNASRKPGSPASGFSFVSSLRSVIQPSPIASVMALASPGLACSSHRRGVTPLVLLLKRSGNISARSFTVEVRNSFEWTAATPFVLCEPTMARLAIRILRFAALLDQAHAFDAALVAGETLADVLQETPVDLVNDLQLPRHQDLKPFHRPLLQSFRQQRVIGICQCLPGQIPCFVPAQVSVIQQNSHQFGDRHGRMCVIQLDRCLLGQPVPIVVQPPEPPYDVGQRTGNQEVFLHEPQTAPMVVESSGYSTRVSDSASSVSARAPMKSPVPNS